MRPCQKAALDALTKRKGSPFVVFRSPDLLQPHVREKFDLWLKALSDLGIQVRLVETWRSATRQAHLFSTRSATKAAPGCSWHQLGRAWDAYPIVDGRVVLDYSAASDIFEAMGAEAEKCGIEWGGRWRKLRDYGHFQVTDGLSIDQAIGFDNDAKLIIEGTKATTRRANYTSAGPGDSSDSATG